MPGGSRRKLNLPSSSEVADAVVPVLWLIRWTTTPGTMALEESSATPVNAPVEDVWLRTGLESRTAIARCTQSTDP
jgi:hypothetical protein